MQTEAPQTAYDVAVIGGGAAGLTAALVLARARRRVVVIDAGEPRNAPAAHMQGFLSRDGMPPADLLAIGRAEVAAYGGVFFSGRVTQVERSANGRFGLLLDTGRALVARRLLIATGLTDTVPELPGVVARWGRDVLHCPYCHGYEVRDQPVGVLGGTPDAVQHAQLVRQWSSDVVFFVHTGEMSEGEREQLRARAIGVVEGLVGELVVEDDHLAGVRLEDGRYVARSAVFIRPQFVSNNDFVQRLGGQIDHQGWPRVDGTGRTSVDGLWAAGNAANPRAQVITAAGEGSAAAIAINNDLTDEDIQNAVEAFHSSRPA